MLKDHKFWIGVLVGYLLIALFPQINFVSKFKAGGAGL